MNGALSSIRPMWYICNARGLSCKGTRTREEAFSSRLDISDWFVNGCVLIHKCRVKLGFLIRLSTNRLKGELLALSFTSVGVNTKNSTSYLGTVATCC